MTPSRAAVCAGGMTLFLLVFEFALLRTPYGEYFPDLFNHGALWGLMRAGALLALVGLQGLYFYASFVSSARGRVAYGVLFAVIVFLQYGYVRATGGFVGGHDFDIAAAELSHWVPMARLHVNWLAAVPVVVYAVALAVPRWPSLGGAGRRLALIVLVTLAVHSAYALSLHAKGDEDVGLIHGSGPPLTSPQAFARAGTMWMWNQAATLYWRTTFGGRVAVEVQPAPAPTRHVVLVVDESVRGDHLSVNGYSRSTTPWLDTRQRDGELVNWGIASSAFPLSNDSVLAILTGVHRFPDRERHTQTRPTIFQFAKAMGYRTHLFDGGARGLRWGLSDDDLRFIDDWGARTRFGDDVETDFRIAREVSQVLDAAAGQFIVVLKRGNHPPYTQNYPREHAVWHPDGFRASASDDPGTVWVNDFDNAIRYNVDRFFQTIDDGGGLDRAVLLYTSDHGQQLADPRESGLSRDVLWGEVAVPMLMIGAARRDVAPGYRASHANIMATLLDLMAVPAELRGDRYARSLVGATAANADPRPVFAGDLYGVGFMSRQNFDELPRPRPRQTP